MANYAYLFMIVYVFIFSFIRGGQADTDELIVVPYIVNDYKTYIILFTLTIALFLTVLRNIKNSGMDTTTDTITVSLIYRAVFLMLPYFYAENISTYWGYYTTNVMALLVYELGKRNVKDFTKVFRVLILFGVILSIQVIVTLLVGGLEYIGEYYKYYMSIPIGKTNYIGCFILPAFIFADMDEKINKKYKYTILIILLIGMIVLRSRGTIFMLIVYYLIKEFPQIMKKRIKPKTIIYCMIICIIGISSICLFGSQYVGYLDIFVFGTDNGTYYNDELSLLDRLTSERFIVNNSIFELALKHPLLGNGTVYEVGTYRAHNFITDSFYQSGIVGTILYLYALWAWYSKIRKVKHDSTIRKFYIPVLIILLQGMIETSVFLIPTDIILWVLVGASYSYANDLDIPGGKR